MVSVKQSADGSWAVLHDGAVVASGLSNAPARAAIELEIGQASVANGADESRQVQLGERRPFCAILGVLPRSALHVRSAS